MNFPQSSEELSIAVISSLTSYSTAGYIVDALIQEGHKTLVISDKDHPLVVDRVLGAFDLSCVLKKHGFKPNLVLFIEGGSMQLFPNGLEEVDCLTAWYGIDTHMSYEKHLRIARLFDVTFVAQKEYVAKLQNDGIKQVFWLPLACEPSLYPQSQLGRIYDIGYVGSDDAKIHPIRHQMLSSLQKHFPSMWSGKASPREMGNIYAQSKMVFNKSVNNDLNMRYFEAMGAGAVLITDPIHANGLEELFEEGQDYLCYFSEENVIDLATSILADPKRLSDIGLSARKKVFANHTYLHRVKQMLLVLSSCGKSTKINLVDYLPVYLALGMSIDALAMLQKILQHVSVGRRQKLINPLIVLSIGIAMAPIRLIMMAYRRVK